MVCVHLRAADAVADDQSRVAPWDSSKDVWKLYNLSSDYSQGEDLAAKKSRRLEEMKELFLLRREGEQGLPPSAPASGPVSIRTTGSRAPARDGPLTLRLRVCLSSQRLRSEEKTPGS